MTREEIEELVKFHLSNNDAQLNNSISAASMSRSVNLAYVRVWNRIRTAVSKEASTTYLDSTWSQGEPTMAVPGQLQQSTILGIYNRDSTQGTTGQRINVQYQKPQLWAWPLYSGPSSDTPIRIYFKIGAEPLQVAASVPALIGPEHHEVIAWETAIYLLRVKNRAVPPDWVTERDDLEFLATKDLLTKPLRNEARIRPNDLSAIMFLG